ncbi:MAG: hypothetical protein PHD43_17620 [Methylococcales bacterium]|nr:hypothetical protein [Methylococcales bacterium]
MSELALKLIAENKRTRSPFLDLGNCGLTEVPEEIGELGACPRTNMLVSGYQYVVLFHSFKALYIVGELVKR